MIDYDLFSRIKNSHEQKGLSANQIAEELDLDPRTVSKWLKENRFRQRVPVLRTSKIDPFKGSIVRMLETHPYSAAQVLQRIREEGFDGGYTIVKDYVRKVRPRKSPAFLKLSFAPGECAQVDWVLCYSRMMYLEFTVSQTMEHWLSCHQNAFAAFARSPKRSWSTTLRAPYLNGS